MNRILRVDSYALACADGDPWRTQWCVARSDTQTGWQFGEDAGGRLQPKRTADENNEYLEAPQAADARGVSDLDLTYFQLQKFLPKEKGPIDLAVSGCMDAAQLESLLGVLAALKYSVRGVLPCALAAARGLAPGRYGIVELGRRRSWISEVEVSDAQARLESVQEYGRFGFSHIFTRWIENVAEAFAAQHRFDVHRNLAENREQLFAQMCSLFAAPAGQMQFHLDSRSVTMKDGDFQAHWQAPTANTDGLELLLLPPLPQLLPIPAQAMGMTPCADPDPQDLAALTATLPEDGLAHRCVALSR